MLAVFVLCISTVACRDFFIFYWRAIAGVPA
jgi:hypothetical protein